MKIRLSKSLLITQALNGQQSFLVHRLTATGMAATIKTCIICIVILLPFLSFGQSNAPLGALPMQYNSSFAGSNGGPRISSFIGFERSIMQYTQYTIPATTSYSVNSSNNAYRLYTAYDQFIPAIKSGIGLTASLSGHNYKYMSQNSTSNTSSSTHEKPRYASLALAIAPKFSINGKYTISPSLDFSYANNKSQAIYIDSVLIPINIVDHNLSSRAAILFNSNKYYIGYSVDLVSRSFSRDNSPVHSSNINKYFNSYLQMGYTFGRSTSKFAFIPQLVLQIHNYPYDNRLRIDLGALNLNFRYKKVIWGFNNGGVHIGWQNEQLRFMLTNNLSFIDREPNYNSFNGSLSLRYLIPSGMQKKYTVPEQ